MQEMKKARFEALAAYCRLPQALFYAEEVRWLQAHDEAILIVVIRDFEDGDYAAMFLARDLKERYRWISITKFFETETEALAAAPEQVEKLFADLDQERKQGDEKGKPVDFFTPVVAAVKLNPDFKTITSLEGYSPTLELIKPMMRWFEDADGNFVEQFQTTGFDARLWELYLFAALVEAGYVFEKSEPMPDFCAKSLRGQICVEATTVNPSLGPDGAPVPPPPKETPEQLLAYQREYMPIRFAGPLTAKLAKKYWEKAHVQDMPLLFAIQDFHAPMSMTGTGSSLAIYLYGVVWEADKDANGNLVIKSANVTQHNWGVKAIDSGFFRLPGSEHISAVISNPSATISKFNRMGMVAGFGSPRVRMIREGTMPSLDPNTKEPLHFTRNVNAQDYTEDWMEGMSVYHNPNALRPLHPAQLPGAAHHFLRADGMLETFVPKFQPFSSVTLISVVE